MTPTYIRSAVLYKAALLQVFLLELWFFPGSIFPPKLLNHVSFIHASAIDYM